MDIGLILIVLVLVIWGGAMLGGWRGFLIGCGIALVVLYVIFGIFVTVIAWTFINHSAGIFFAILFTIGLLPLMYAMTGQT